MIPPLLAAAIALASWAEPAGQDVFESAARQILSDSAETARRLRELPVQPAAAVAGTFAVSPLAGGEFDKEGLARGLEEIYARSCGPGCLDAPARRAAVARAEAFGGRVRAAIEGARAGGGWPYRLEAGRTRLLGSVVRYELSFPSPLPRGGHPSDAFRAYLFLPRDIQGCGRVFPGAVMVHHLSENVRAEMLLAEVLAMHEGLPGRSGGLASLVLFLPHYGPRKGPEGVKFLSADLDAYERNLTQAIVEIHLARDLLASLPFIDPGRIAYWGASLGAIVGYVSAGLDPGFTGGYSLLVGGGNLPAIIRAVMEKSAHWEQAKEFGLSGLEEKTVLEKLAPLDALTWSHRARGVRLQLINTEGDPLISPGLSLEPLLAQYRAEGRGNTVEYLVSGSGHSQDVDGVGALLKLWRQLLRPYRDFALQGDERAGECRSEGTN